MNYQFINNLLENKYLKKLLLISLFIVTSLLLIIENKHFITLEAYDNDKYGTAFLNFWRLGWYQGCVEGYGILYNEFVGFFYRFTNNIYNSFFAANLISQLLCAIISVKLLAKYKHKINSFEYQIILVLSFFQLLNTKGYDASYDDSFLAVFISLITFILFTRIETILTDRKSLIWIGILLAICLAIRPTTAFLVFSLSIIFIILILKEKQISKKIVFNFSFLIIPFVILTGVLHFPSLKEKGKLSFYDKNSKDGANWNQRNYHALKQMQSGKAPKKKDVFWDKKRWKEVDELLLKNGKNSIPNNIFKTFVSDPLVVSLITIYNILFTLFWNIRNYGILIFLPLIALIKKPLFDYNKLPFLMFMLVCFIVSFVSLTFMEIRWFSGYLILVPIGIILAISEIKNSSILKYWNLIFIFSVSLSLLMNLKSLLGLIQQL